MGHGTTRRKTGHVPLATDAEVADVVARFEACPLPGAEWTHRAHLAVVASYLREYPLPDALDRVRRHIQFFNNHRGLQEGYPEAVPVVFLRAVAAYSEVHPGRASPRPGANWLWRTT